MFNTIESAFSAVDITHHFATYRPMRAVIDLLAQEEVRAEIIQGNDPMEVLHKADPNAYDDLVYTLELLNTELETQELVVLQCLTLQKD